MIASLKTCHPWSHIFRAVAADQHHDARCGLRVVLDSRAWPSQQTNSDAQVMPSHVLSSHVDVHDLHDQFYQSIAQFLVFMYMCLDISQIQVLAPRLTTVGMKSEGFWRAGMRAQCTNVRREHGLHGQYREALSCQKIQVTRHGICQEV